MKVVFTLLLCFCAVMASAQRINFSPNNQADQPLDKSTKNEVLKLMIDRIKENYYDREGWQAINDHLKSLRKTDDFKAANTLQTFSRYMTLALRSFTNDPHFNVLYNPPLFAQAQSFADAPPPAQRPAIKPEEDPDAHGNFFMPKVEVLEGNIGYLKIERMANIQTAKGTLHAALNFLAYTDGMIIDIRGNRGGIGGFTPYLASHFFKPEKKLLFSREMPAYDSVSNFYVEEKLSARRFVEQPLYILIDSGTGSAARNLAYTLQKHNRAELVGTPTGVGSAGGHSAGLFPLVNGFVATVPIANVVHPVTQSNWSMVGVIPDHEVNDSQSLNKVHVLALKEIMDEADETVKDELKKIINRIEESSKQKKEGIDQDWEDYVGAYEQRKIFTQDGKLYLQRDGGPALELAPIEKDLFDMVLPSGARSNTPLPDVRFVRNENGEITHFDFLRENGTIETTVKKL